MKLEEVILLKKNVKFVKRSCHLVILGRGTQSKRNSFSSYLSAFTFGISI
jgi:hypothetical protein